MKACLLLHKPYVDLPKIVKRIESGDGNAQDLEHQLEAISERAAAIAAYIGEACGTYGCGRKSHEDALKAMNITRKKVRKAIGYDITHNIIF